MKRVLRELRKLDTSYDSDNGALLISKLKYDDMVLFSEKYPESIKNDKFWNFLVRTYNSNFLAVIRHKVDFMNLYLDFLQIEKDGKQKELSEFIENYLLGEFTDVLIESLKPYKEVSKLLKKTINLNEMSNEIIFNVMREMNYEDLVSYCIVNTNMKNFCGDWKIILYIKYPEAAKYATNMENVNYKKVVMLLNEMEDYMKEHKENLTEDITKEQKENLESEYFLDITNNKNFWYIFYFINNYDGDNSQDFYDNILAFSSKYNYYMIVDLLLKDGRADPTYKDNYTLSQSSFRGYHKIVDLLLKDGRVDPGYMNNVTLLEASENGRYKVVDLLLKDERVDPESRNSDALFGASKWGHYKVVKLFIEDGRVSPLLRNSKILRDVIKNYYKNKKGIIEEKTKAREAYELIKILLKDGMADPNNAYDNNKTKFIINKDRELYDLFLNDGRVDIEKKDQCYRCKSKRTFQHIVQGRSKDENSITFVTCEECGEIRRKTLHPKYRIMVVEAIKYLRKTTRNTAKLYIKKYISSKYNINIRELDEVLNRKLIELIRKGVIHRTHGGWYKIIPNSSYKF